MTSPEDTPLERAAPDEVPRSLAQRSWSGPAAARAS